MKIGVIVESFCEELHTALRSAAAMGIEGVQIYGPGGCTKCHGIGFKGRGSVMEVLPITDTIRAEIVKNSPASIIREQAIREGMITLKEAGLRKVAEGVTSLHAVLEVTGSE